jgi:hypothetical protein
MTKRATPLYDKANDSLLYNQGGYGHDQSITSTTKVCRACKHRKSIEEYPYFSTSSAGRKNTCKKCSSELAELRKKLKHENPPPHAGKCPICEEYTRDWILDHCHFEHKFRGYICNSCNLGLGRFNDDEKLLHNAIKYLQNHKV